MILKLDIISIFPSVQNKFVLYKYYCLLIIYARPWSGSGIFIISILLTYYNIMILKLKEVYRINKWLTDKIYPWQEIQLPIEDADEYVDRKFERTYQKNSQTLQQIENQRLEKIKNLQNTEWKVPMFQFQSQDFENRLEALEKTAIRKKKRLFNGKLGSKQIETILA